MKTTKNKNLNIKKIINTVLGIPSAFIIMCETYDLTSLVIKLVAIAIVFGLLVWNICSIKEGDYYKQDWR